MASYGSDKLILLIINDNKSIILSFLMKFIAKSKNIRLHILAISNINDSNDIKQKYMKIIGNIPINVQFGKIDNIDDLNLLTIGDYNQKYILQIGYVNNNNFGPIIKNNLKNYDYFYYDNLELTIKLTNEESFMNYIERYSNKSYPINTMVGGKLLIPYYNMELIETFNEESKYELIKLGFKNIFSIKLPNSYTAHHYGHNGEIYEIVKSMYETLYKIPFEEKVVITGESHNEAINYFNEINKNNFDFEFREKQYKNFYQNNEIQIIGLARIIQGLYLMFKFPRKNILSINQIFNNNPKNLFKIYIDLLNNHKKLEITPCYDLISTIALIKFIEGKYNDYFDVNHTFKYINESNILQELILEFN